jgi:hypothetical protein
MKKFLSITAILACLLFTACKKTKGISAKFKFSGTPSAKASQSPAKKSTSVEGAEMFELFYSHSKLGAKKGSITPTTFELAIDHLRLHYMNDEFLPAYEAILGVETGANLVDFANPVVITLDVIPPGDYKIVEFSFWFGGIGGYEFSANSKVIFPIPEGCNIRNHSFYSRFADHINNNVVIDQAYFLEPHEVARISWSFGPADTYYYADIIDKIDVEVKTLSTIFMGGNTYRLITDSIEGANLSKIVSGMYDHPYMPGTLHIVVPFEGIVIPENAKAVRFEIFWDITGMIEWYDGATDSPHDDIFVLKNKFWEGFSIQAFIEY